MTLPVRKSKRKLESEAAVEAEKNETEKATEPMDTGEAEEGKEPEVKKPRQDTAEAADNKGVEEGKKEEEGTATPAVDEQPKEGENKEGEDKTETAPTTENSTEKAPDTPNDANAPGQKPEEPAATADKQAETPAGAAPGAAAGAVKQEETPPTPAAVPAPLAPIYKEEEYEEPDDGQEIPEDSENVWNARLVDLLLYKHQYRTLHVQASYDQHLHAWVDIQRKLYRRHKNDPKSVSALTQLRLTVLDSINFPFTLRGAVHWNRYFDKLKEFNTKHGMCWILLVVVST